MPSWANIVLSGNKLISVARSMTRGYLVDLGGEYNR